jgi:ABC-type spermidine/putrescine transport system permease subunit I
VLVIREFHISLELTTRSYLFFLGSPLYLWILGKSVLLALGVTAACLVLAYPFAIFLTKLPRSAQRTMLVLVILPFWTSYLLRVYAWMTLLGESGLINRGLASLGLLDEPLRFLLYNNFSVVLVSVYLYLPYAALALYTALERLDLSLIDAAKDLGARPWQVFWHVTLPLTLPGVFASFIFVFIPMVGEYAEPGRRRPRIDDRQRRGLAGSGASLRHCFRHGLRHRRADPRSGSGAEQGRPARAGVRCLSRQEPRRSGFACMAC